SPASTWPDRRGSGPTPSGYSWRMAMTEPDPFHVQMGTEVLTLYFQTLMRAQKVAQKLGRPDTAERTLLFASADYGHTDLDAIATIVGIHVVRVREMLTEMLHDGELAWNNQFNLVRP